MRQPAAFATTLGVTADVRAPAPTRCPERHHLLTDMTFGALGVPKPLLAVLLADDKTTSFPIQEATLPDALAGRDILGRGKTGSGKTLAFAIPMVARLGASGAGHGK